MSDEQTDVELDGDVMVIRVPIRIRRRGGRQDVVVPDGAQLGPADGNDAIVVALARGHHWRDLLESGRFESMTELASKLGVDRTYVRRMVQLTFLPPRIVEAALAGEDVGSLAEMTRSSLREWTTSRPLGDSNVRAPLDFAAKQPPGIMKIREC